MLYCLVLGEHPEEAFEVEDNKFESISKLEDVYLGKDSRNRACKKTEVVASCDEAIKILLTGNEVKNGIYQNLRNAVERTETIILANGPRTEQEPIPPRITNFTTQSSS
ncbi:12243_t:CDS:2 [Funneliformis caledonium]|uniref:12243_t:CDS:1 n=1 Tax=Funneliformis caledonium TaxID=1117310 RepID=A0A9N8WAH0_9GLOM|nr:12243_t:CDS:2 [Funneliformis caledonium]